MGRRRQSGWFARVIKVVASISALVAWTGHVFSTVDGAANDVNAPLPQRSDDGVKIPVRPQNGADGIDITSVVTEACPLKKPVVESNCDIFYILVSTIDGKMSALDLHKKGSLVWSVDADSQPLFSSSLANMEMIRNGKKLRLIPSLDGALYQYDGEKVEAIPMSAEMLLSSTYKLSDDSMIVGSKDLRNFGINLRSGEILFTCGSEGCTSNQEETKEEPLDGNNILVVTRSTQVVRSVDIKYGNEKWNFSVGQHQINLPNSSSRPSEIDEDYDDIDIDEDVLEDSHIPLFTASSDECPMKETAADDIDYEDALQLLVPEGKVVALSKEDSSQVSWEHKFESPIAKAWVFRQGKLSPMSLFDSRHVPSLHTFTTDDPDDMENDSMPQPLLYIGSHQKLLYIQPSPQMENVLKTFTNRRVGHVFDPDIKVSWRPYLNTASVRTPIFGGNRQQVTQQSPTDIKDKKASTSLTVWNEDYPFDTGYFLYPEFRDARFHRRDVMLIEDLNQRSKSDQEDVGLIEAIPASLWMYWKEVVIISVTMSLVVHVVLTKFFNPNRSTKADCSDSGAKDSSRNSNSSDGLIVSSDSTPLLADRQSSTGDYVSRFSSDFDCVSCLGKGGFGVVFEAVNKVDDQHYAVKRTMLPRSEGAKEKVLREVRALAKLEHIGIVRYFNAWVESPPAGWQEERDKQYQFSDMSGPSTYSKTTSYPDHYQDRLQIPASAAKRAKQAKATEVGLRVVRPDVTEEASLDDSIVFSSEITSEDLQLKQSGSGEFSVHSNLDDSRDGIEDSFNNPKSNLFSFGFDSFTDPSHSGSHGDSVNNSKSSIPFSNYTSTSSILFSHQTDQDMTGDSVVFESNSNLLSYDKLGLESKGTSDDTDSIVFEKSQTHSDKLVKNENKFTLSQSHAEHHTVDISLSSHKRDGENAEEKNESSDKVQPGTKFFLYIQMQLYRKETLKDWLSSNTLNRDRHTILDIFDQIVCAVDYVHSQGLMHRDLKPSNIFFTADGVVKVGDFGLVTALSVQQDQEPQTTTLSSDRHTAEVGTTLYMSPEQIARKPYDLKIDIFSLGLIFLELWIPFSTQMERIRTLQDAKKQIFPSRFKRELPKESELVHTMTSADPAIRPSTMDILDHPLFKDLAPTRLGTKHRKRTISDNSAS